MVLDDSGPLLTVSLDTRTLVTGIGLRDRHMAAAIESDKYPTAKLVFPDDVLHRAPGRADAAGELTFHGVTRRVPVTYTVSGEGPGRLNVDATLPIDIREFGVTPPSYMGVSVKPNVTVHVTLDVDES